MTEPDREVQEALEEDGYEVERIGLAAANPDGTEERSGGAWLGYVLWLEAYVVARGGEEMTRELMHGVLGKVKQIIRRRRKESEGQAHENQGVTIWLPDGSGGWELVVSERVDE